MCSGEQFSREVCDIDGAVLAADGIEMASNFSVDAEIVGIDGDELIRRVGGGLIEVRQCSTERGIGVRHGRTEGENELCERIELLLMELVLAFEELMKGQEVRAAVIEVNEVSLQLKLLGKSS